MKVNGIGASAGIVISKVFRLEDITLDIPTHNCVNAKDEMGKLKNAIEKAQQTISVIKKNTLETLDEEHAMIFDAHMQIANDPEIYAQVKQKVESENLNVVKAYSDVTTMFADLFASMDNAYMKERAADVKDVSRRVIANLLDITLNDPSTINSEVIICANDLTPSDTAQLNKKYVKGFVTNIGGRTSHSAIMARTLEIPAVVGTINVLDSVEDGDIIILNGMEGYVILNPTEDEIKDHKQAQAKYLEKVAIYKQFKDKKTITKDGLHVELAANIGNPEDMDGVIANGAEGVGLYRTEFLYMNSPTFPTEEEQFIAYKTVLEKIPTNKVVIRTLDIGGDKHLEYLPLDKELNPFLGHRALRLCLDNVNLFKTQLRALLRASVYGNLHIMFPMVATLNEFRKAKKLIEECKIELKNENVAVSENFKVGIMVEIPSVAILADQFAKEVDFFSIGTNDLIQYSFAAGRMNEKVSYLYQPLNPSLLRLIKMVIDASHKEGIWTGMCGEMAGDQLAAPILLGLGLDEFSMSATSVLETRYLFSKLSKTDMETIANKALQMGTESEVKELILATLDKII
jgi:phosphotransferase system enzyme I (PtsI)